MTNVLVISSSFPYPVDIGRKVIISGFLEYFVSAFGSDNVVFVYVTPTDEPPPRMQLGCDVIALPLGGVTRRLAGATWECLARRRRAVQEMMVYSRTAAVRVANLIRKVSPDLVIVDTVRMAQYVEKELPRAACSFLYLDDLYSLRYRRMLAAMQAHPDVAFDSIGSFGRFIPRSLRGLAGGSAVQKALLRLESGLLEKREREMPGHFDRVLLLNGDEAARLGAQTGAKNIHVVKPLLRGHRGRLRRRFAGDPTYVFLGNLQYPANAYSLSMFMHQAMPALVRAQPDAKLIVVGRGAKRELLEQGRAWGDRVRFMDFVEDLAPVMAEAAAMIVPLIYGSGLKMKVLDALYYGVPIVSTSIGVDGVPVTAGRHCFVEDRIADFARPLTQLLDVDVNRRVSNMAQALYADQFAPDVVWGEYQALFGAPDLPVLLQRLAYAQ